MSDEAPIPPAGPNDPSPFKSSFVADKLAEDLRKQIESGALKSGELILPVRQLAERYKISYNSVRKALEVLAHEGLLSLERGRGTFVRGGTPAQSPSDSLSAPRGGGGLSATPSRPTTPPPAPRATPAPAKPAPQLPPPTPAPAAPAGMLFDPQAEPPRMLGLRAIAGRLSMGMIFPGSPDALFSSPACRGAWTEIQRRVLENGDLLTVVSGHGRKSLPAPEQLAQSGFSGVLLLGVREPRLLAEFAANPLPCVLLGASPEGIALDSVALDNFSAGYLLAKHLINFGHRSLAFLRVPGNSLEAAGDFADPGGLEREAAVKLALKEDNLTLQDSHILECAPDPAWMESLVERLLSLHPAATAVLVSEERLARMLCENLRARGVDVPGRISVACFGAKDGSDPVFSAARADYGKMGEAAVSRLRQLIAGGAGSRLRINIPVEIQKGRTSGPWRG